MKHLTDETSLLLLQASEELKYGRVSAAELVQAVQEMLSAAGMNMDVEKRSLLQKTITLQEQLKESQAAYLVEQVCNIQFKIQCMIESIC